MTLPNPSPPASVPESFFSRYFFWLQDHLLLLLVVCVVGLLVPWNEVIGFTQNWLKEARETVTNHPFDVVLIYTLAYLLITGFSVPGPTVLILNILAGWLFGMWGLPLASFCSSTGALIAFLSSRYLLRESLLLRRASTLKNLSAKFMLESPAVLFACRLNPLVPYFLLNLLYGRSRMPLWQFWLVTLIGMLPLITLYVITGNAMASIEYLDSPLSLQQITLFIGLSIFTLLMYWSLGHLFFAKRITKTRG